MKNVSEVPFSEKKEEEICWNQFTAPEGQSFSDKSLGETSKNKDGGKQLSTETASEEKIVSGKRRLSDVKEDESEEEIYDLEEDCSGRRIFDLESLVSGIEQAAVCKNCKEGSLLLREDGKMGLASQMTFKCVECGEETSFNTDCKTGRFFPVNRSAVFASKFIGRGYVALTKVMQYFGHPWAHGQKNLRETFKTHQGCGYFGS